jgi:hypothetical protein
MSPEERLEFDIIFAAEAEDLRQQQARANVFIDAFTPGQQIGVMTDLQTYVGAFPPDEQPRELAHWLDLAGAS